MQLLHHSVHSVVPSVRVSVATCMTSHTGAAPQRALELEQQSGCLGNTCKCRARLYHQAGLAPTRHLPTRWNTRGMAVRTYTCPRYVLFKLELRVGLLEAACIRPTMPSQERSPPQSVCRQKGGDSQAEQMPLAHMAHFPRDMYRLAGGDGHIESRAKEAKTAAVSSILSWDDVIAPGSTRWA